MTSRRTFRLRTASRSCADLLRADDDGVRSAATWPQDGQRRVIRPRPNPHTRLVPEASTSRTTVQVTRCPDVMPSPTVHLHGEHAHPEQQSERNKDRKSDRHCNHLLLLRVTHGSCVNLLRDGKASHVPQPPRFTRSNDMFIGPGFIRATPGVPFETDPRVVTTRRWRTGSHLELSRVRC